MASHVVLSNVMYVHLNHVGLCCWGLSIHLSGSFQCYVVKESKLLKERFVSGHMEHHTIVVKFLGQCNLIWVFMLQLELLCYVYVDGDYMGQELGNKQLSHLGHFIALWQRGCSLVVFVLRCWVFYIGKSSIIVWSAIIRINDVHERDVKVF